MQLYRKIVGRMEQQIAAGIYGVGDRIPSVRQASQSLGVSMTTINHAYAILEEMGLIRARPQSGYIVIRTDPTRTPPALDGVSRVAAPFPNDLEGIALEVMGAGRHQRRTPFGAAYPDSQLFPLAGLLRMMRDASRRPTAGVATPTDAAGASELRREIAKRYAQRGKVIPVDEIIVTAGGLNSVSLALSTILRPGDAVAIEDPSFFSNSFALRRFGLRAIPVKVSPVDGIDLDALERVVSTQCVRACLMMTSCHNPLGVTLGGNKREALVRLLRRYDVPLIENDVYGELVPPAEHDPVNDYDEAGLVLRCGTFSNYLSPELRVGWVTAGRFRDRMLSAQFLSSGAAPWLAQQTIAEFLKRGSVDRYLRNLRAKLNGRMKSGLEGLNKWGHLIRSRSCPTSGFMVWLELSPGIDSLHLYRQAADQGLSFVPGALFSVNRKRSNEIALNFSHRWTGETSTALDRLMTLVQSATDGAR